MRWRRSSRSASAGYCVEVAALNTGVAVRDSKDPTGPMLLFTGREWQAYVDSVKQGRR